MSALIQIKESIDSTRAEAALDLELIIIQNRLQLASATVCGDIVFPFHNLLLT